MKPHKKPLYLLSALWVPVVQYFILGSKQKKDLVNYLLTDIYSMVYTTSL